MRPRRLATSSPVVPRAVFNTTAFDTEGTVTLGNLAGITFNGAEWSMELWVYPEALTDAMTLISREGEFSLTTSGAAIVATVVNGGTYSSGAVLETNTWNYIVVTSDGSTMKLYVDAILEGFVSVSPGNANSGNPMTIGGGFIGQLEYVRFWSSIVSGTAMAQNQLTYYASGTTDLLAQIQFDAEPIVDSSGNDVPVTVASTDVDFMTFTPSADLTGLGFCAPFLDSGVNPAGAQSDFSIMAWVAPAQLSGSQVIFANGTVGANGTSLALNTAGNVVFQVGSAAPVTSTAQLSNETWANVTCTWSASTGNAALYVNGVADSTGTMSLATTAAGSLLLGAGIGSAGYPANNFIGYIQSVDVFNSVLSQTSVTAYQTASPLSNGNLVGEYNFGAAIPMNVATANFVGLLGAAALSDVVNAPPPFDEGGNDFAAVPAPAASFVPPNVRREHFSADRREAMVAEFRQFMTETLHVPADRQEEFAARMAANLGRVATEVASGTHRVSYYLTTEQLPGGTTTITLHNADGATVIYTADAALTPCQTWAIGFVFDIVVSLLTVLGFAVNTTKIGAQFGRYFGNRIMAIYARLQKAFSGAGTKGPTPKMVYNALYELWNAQGLLSATVDFVWQGVTNSGSAWTAFRLAAEITLFFSPWAPLAAALFIADLALAMATLISDWQNQPANCWS